MCDFKPGDEIAAVDDGGFSDIASPSLVVGRVYTCAAVEDTGSACGECGSILGVDVVEIQNDLHWYCACSFRKVQRRDLSAWLKTSIGNTDKLDKRQTKKVPA